MPLKYTNIYWLWVSAAIILADQITKQLVVRNMEVYDTIYLLPVLNITYLRNTGAAFSMLSDAPPLFFITLGVAVAIGIMIWMRRHPDDERMTAAGLALILGGALGNVIDRAMPSRGYVVDFIDFHIGECSYCHWPAFNVADSAIVIGAGLLILDMILESRRQKRSSQQP